jgi:hypothetical protein
MELNDKGEFEACNETFGLMISEMKKQIAFYQRAEAEGRLTISQIPNPSRMKVIYVAHKFNGDPKNVKKVEKIIRDLVVKYPDYTFYSPLHNTGFFYDDIPYEIGMKHCIEMLSRSDEIWFCSGWKKSRGCNIEHDWAAEHGVTIKELE